MINERKINWFVILLLFAGCSDNDNQNPFDAELQALAEKENLPSLVVGLLDDQDFTHKSLFGFSNKPLETPATDETIYYLASISKVFTAIAALQLVEKGLLDLDEDINTYLSFEVRNPNYPDDPITIRMLLGHRSSLADKNYGVYSNQTAPAMYPAIEYILVPSSNPRYEADIWRNVRPDSDYLYSNITTALLGYLIEVVSGMDYNEYCKKNIFEPLGMENTSHSLNDLDQSKIARPYVNGSDVGLYSTEFYPSGMCKSTLNDLGKFVLAMINLGEWNGQRTLETSSMNEMLTLHNSPYSPIGYIWYRYSSLNGFWGHAGWFRGYQTMLFFDPVKKKGAIILSNSSTAPGNPILFNGEITKLVNQQVLK